MKAQGDLEGRAFVLARTDGGRDGQHVLATGGFGCSPDSGGKVFIRFEDGHESWTRRDCLDEAEAGYVFPEARVFAVLENDEGFSAHLYATGTATDAYELERAIVTAEGADDLPKFIMMAYDHHAFGWGGVRTDADGHATEGGPERRFHILPLAEYRMLTAKEEAADEAAAAV